MFRQMSTTVFKLDNYFDRARVFFHTRVEMAKDLIVAREFLKKMLPPRIELRTFCELSRRDNRYTTEAYTVTIFVKKSYLHIEAL